MISTYMLPILKLNGTVFNYKLGMLGTDGNLQSERQYQGVDGDSFDLICRILHGMDFFSWFNTASDKYKFRHHRRMLGQNPIEEALPLILVYYRFRGQLQPIRNLYCYLELPFIQIHCEYFMQQMHYISPMILNHVAKMNMHQRELPALIHGNTVVEGLYPIIVYTCKRFNRNELFGSNIRIRSRQEEIFQIYLLKQPQSMTQLFSLTDRVQKCQTDAEINQQTSQLCDKLMANSKYIREICQYLDQQPPPKYIFGELTLIDFFFFETCQYMNGVFGADERVNMKDMLSWDTEKGHRLEKPNVYYMQIIKKYKERMKQEPWYIKHKDYLQSFSIINSTITAERVKALRRIWLGNPKSVA